MFKRDADEKEKTLLHFEVKTTIVVVLSPNETLYRLSLTHQKDVVSQFQLYFERKVKLVYFVLVYRNRTLYNRVTSKNLNNTNSYLREV